MTGGDEGTGADEPTDDDSTAADGLSADRRFEALRNRRRRDVIEYLTAADGAVTIGEIAEHVAAIENDTTVDAVTADQRKRVYVGLYQSHLPKLDDMDVVAYDQDEGDLRLGPNASQLYPYLPGVGTDEGRPWERIYLGYGLASLAVLSTVLLLSPTADAVTAGLSLAVVGGLCALALGHAIDRRR